MVLPGLRFFNFAFEVRRPGKGDEEPHQQCGGDRKESVIEEADGNKTENQTGASPEPDVLMKHIQYDDSKNKQEVFHGGQNLTSPFGTCQASLYTDYTDIVNNLRICG